VKKPTDSLFVMANHGQLLEYSLEPVPDHTLPREKVPVSIKIFFRFPDEFIGTGMLNDYGNICNTTGTANVGCRYNILVQPHRAEFC